jgi:hypothetical protein
LKINPNEEQNWLNVRKKPIIIQAVQVNEPFTVDSMEGTMSGKAGDYLMKGVKGELYICDREVFESSYDVVG